MTNMPYILRKQKNEKIDSWAIRWCFHQSKKVLYTIFISKYNLISIGFGLDATYTIKTSRTDINLSCGEQHVFSFDNKTILDKTLIPEYQNKFFI